MSPPTSSEPVTSNSMTSRPLAAAMSQDALAPPVLGLFTDQALWARVVRDARCTDGGLDPDQWFPVSAEAGRARQEAAAAIAVCAACRARGQCLEFSLRHWDVGQHGVWGGLVAADRAQLRRRLRTARSSGYGPAVTRRGLSSSAGSAIRTGV